ncbi:hypothetical protein B0H14DRAFT_3710259 [Mycena olivaceomarginata]|nr:hypothetical protein B0H14DRAFT_3710259 [Mycena olivaceomarginata]
MAEEPAFRLEDWIGQGKTMATAPPMIHKLGKEIFTIPQSIEFELFPSPFLTIEEMLKFDVPLQSLPNNAPQPAQYFSSDSVLQRLRHLPIPDAKDIRKLFHSGRQAWLDGKRSIMYNNLGGKAATRFPLWVLTYWNKIVDFKRDVRGPWIKSSVWLAQQKKQSKKNPARAALLVETDYLLTMMPWGWAKPQGLSDSEPLYNLHRFLGTDWLAGSQLNDMLELLHQKIDDDPGLCQKFRVHGTALVSKILDAYKAGAETYKDSRGYRWLRDVGDDLVQSGAALLTAGHLGRITREPHWIGVVFDLSNPTGKILYGDSLGEDIPAELLSATRWWISQHTEVPVEAGSLPVGIQKDGYSCGMFVNNALQHWVDPEIPLGEPGSQLVEARLSIFNKIAKWAIERREIERASAIREDEDSDDNSDADLTATTWAENDPHLAEAISSPLLLRHTARDTEITFTFPLPTSKHEVPAVSGVKRAKGHPDAPTPNPSPQKRLRFKRASKDAIEPPPRLTFGSVPLSPSRRGRADVFGPINTCTQSSEELDSMDTDDEEQQDRNAPDGVFWGPEDDAMPPPESQLTQSTQSSLIIGSWTVHGPTSSGQPHNTTYTDPESIASDLPALTDISDSEGDESDSEDDEADTESLPGLADVTDDDASDDDDTEDEPDPAPLPQPTVSAQPRAPPKPRITGYFKVETAEEKALRLERDNRKYAERSEANTMREIAAKHRKAAQTRADTREHVQRYRARKLDEKIAMGWVPGQKRY